MCWKLFKLQSRVQLWRSFCTGTSFNLCGCFGLSSLQHNPAGNLVTRSAFIGIDFYKEAGFVSKEFMVSSLRGKTAHVKVYVCLSECIC